MMLIVYILLGRRYNNPYMAYDHSGDISANYATEVVSWHLSYREHLEAASARARQTNRLNRLGYEALARTLHRFTGKFGGNVLLGAKMYIAITDTPHVGGDTFTTPTYKDAEGSQIAEEVTGDMDTIKDARDLEIELYSQMWEMALNAPYLTSLIEQIARSHTSAEAEIGRVKMGAAMMRAMHIHAAQRLAQGPKT